MKKMLSVMLVVLLLFSTVACGEENNATESNSSEETTNNGISDAGLESNGQSTQEHSAESGESQGVESFESEENDISFEGDTSVPEQGGVSDESADSPSTQPDISDTPDASDTPDESGQGTDLVLYENIYTPIDYGIEKYYPDLFRGYMFWSGTVKRYGAESYYRVLILMDSQENYDYKYKYLSDHMYFVPDNMYVYYPLLSLENYIESYKEMYEKDAQTIKELGIDAEMQWAFYTKENEKRTMENPENVFYDYGFVATVRGDVLLNFIDAIRSRGENGGVVFWMKEGHDMQDLYYEYEGNHDSQYNIYVAEGPDYMQFVRPQ